MDAVVEGLWGLADEHERRGEVGKAVKCLEAICQSQVSFLPMVEVKTRLRVAQLLLDHTHNLNHAKAHLERAHLLLKSIPSCFELKCRAHSLLGHCYHLIGALPPQKHILHRALDLIHSLGDGGREANLWSCNFRSQLANALVVEGDYQASLSALEDGFATATQMCYPELQMFFATSALHVHLLQWEDTSLVQKALLRCSEIWESIPSDQRRHCNGLFFYNELLYTFYLLRVCDFKSASQHVEKLDDAMKDELQQTQHIKELTMELNAVNQSLSRSDLQRKERSALSQKQIQLQEQLKDVSKLNTTSNSSFRGSCFENPCWKWNDKLQLAPPPTNGEWLPKNAIFALIDLMVVMLGRSKGVFKECTRRIQSGLSLILGELGKLGIGEDVTEVNLQNSAIWMTGLYLMLLMHFLENKVAIELTRSEFVEAREALVQMKTWFIRFPTILQGCESIIEILRGQYAHSVGCFNEAIFHFLEATKLTESKSMQSMSQVYAAVSYICIGDAESSSQALDLIGPVFGIMDSFVGVREKTCVIFVYGLLLTKQHNLQEARIRLASGLKIAHQQLGNIQLVSQFLTILGTLALQLHDTGQAREILKSALTLAKTLYDIPTQIWVISVLTDLYKEQGERGNEMENAEYERKKEDDLQRKLSEAQASIHHLELIEKARFKVQQPLGLDIKRAVAGPAMKVDLDIPESVGLQTPAPSSSRLRDLDSSKRGRRKF
uniref:MAU2 chromatid cohesion factor n=1 Tax=Anthurium amnicola TaxID=1678845 RepID=A0A1D1Z995_9ARAE